LLVPVGAGIEKTEHEDHVEEWLNSGASPDPIRRLTSRLSSSATDTDGGSHGHITDLRATA